MVKDMIPKPRSLRPGACSAVGRIGEILSEKNIMSLETYKAFKKSVRKAASDCLPDITHKHHEYEPVLWKKVIDQIKEQYPNVKQCVNLWPIISYYDAWVANSLASSARHRPTLAGSERDKNPMAFMQTGENSIPWVGGPPFAQTGKPVLQPHPLASINLNIPRSRPCSPVSIAPAEPYPEPCFSCGANPLILDRHRMELTNFLTINGMTDMLPALNSFGILHDGHLHILMSLDNGDREKVMSGILARPDMIEFLKHLKHVASVRAMLISTFSGDSTHTLAFPDSLSYMIRAYQCPLHGFNGPFSQELFDFLKTQELEVLVPIATTLYGIAGDVQFRRLCKLSAEALDSFVLDNTLEVSAFHQRVLHLTFQKARLIPLTDTM